MRQFLFLIFLPAAFHMPFAYDVAVVIRKFQKAPVQFADGEELFVFSLGAIVLQAAVEVVVHLAYKALYRTLVTGMTAAAVLYLGAVMKPPLYRGVIQRRIVAVIPLHPLGHVVTLDYLRNTSGTPPKYCTASDSALKKNSILVSSMAVT